MADKKFIHILFLLFLFPALILSQEAVSEKAESEDQNYFLTKTETGEDVFIQKLEWQFQEYVLRYEVELEKKNNDAFEKIDLIKTDNTFIEVSLTHGEYRYRIHVYNLLDKLDSTSDWISFVILKAERPEISSFSPRNFYLDETEDIAVTVNGINLKSDALYYFLPEDGTLLGQVNAQLLEINTDLTRVRINVNSDSFNEGRYTLHVKNPGGLEAELAGLQVQYQDPSDVYVCAGWSPGIIISPLFQEIGGKTGHLLSFSGRVSPIFIKTNFGYFGLEAYGNLLYFNNGQEDYTITGFFSNATISALYQYPIIKKKLLITGKLGAGAAFAHNIEYIYPNNAAYPAISTMFINTTTGFFVNYMITENLFASAGVDYLLVFGTPLQVGDPLPSLLYPHISMGWKF